MPYLTSGWMTPVISQVKILVTVFPQLLENFLVTFSGITVWGHSITSWTRRGGGGSAKRGTWNFKIFFSRPTSFLTVNNAGFLVS